MTADIGLPLVFLAGLLSFLSPCVLPLVPAYMTYLAGATADHVAGGAVAARNATGRAVSAALLFVAGFSTVFVALGATASMFGAVLRQYLDVLTIAAGVAIIVMGLHFLGVFRIGLLFREARFQSRRPVGLWGAYVMGLAFAFGWTPCIGPVLAAVLAVAASEATVARGAGLLTLYSAGLGTPFVVAALAAKPFAAFLQRFKAHLGLVEKITGVLLVLVGLAFLFGWMADFAFWLLEMFPALGRLG